MLKFLPLGGAGEIGANSFYLNIDGTGIILDCGMHPQKIGQDALPRFDLIGDNPVDFVLISHAHQDHIGALPYLVQRHPYIRIITTPQTRALAELTLHNSVSIMKQQLTDEDEIKIYTHEEIDLLIKSIEYRSYSESFELIGYGRRNDIKITCRFYDAGHILGSAGILIEFDGRSLFYTGDINLDSQMLIPGADLPEIKADVLLLETTYGATDSATLLEWNREAARLAKSINKVMNSGGSVLIPVFSLGKMQEILATIWILMQKRKLTLTDIYTGGIAEKISRVYDYNRYVVNRTDKEFEIRSIPQKDLYEIDNIEEFFKNPCIVLAPSGMMMEGTASYKLAKHWVRRNSSAIFTVGYMEENTPGYKYANAEKGSKIILDELEELDIKCSIEQFRFSAHSNREELISIVKKLKPEKVVLVHGDPPAIDWMGAAILKNFKGTKVFEAEPGRELLL